MISRLRALERKSFKNGWPRSMDDVTEFMQVRNALPLLLDVVEAAQALHIGGVEDSGEEGQNLLAALARLDQGEEG